MIEFKLPSLGADMDAGTLLKWHVKPGDHVKRGQVVAVVDTSKAAVDVEIWQDGTVKNLLVQPGEKVPVGTVLATLQSPGETPAAAAPVEPPATAPPALEPASAPEPAPQQEPVPAPKTARAAVKQRVVRPQSKASQAAVSGRQPVSPAARLRAKALGIDPDAIVGTGVQSSVTLEDVEKAAQSITGTTEKAGQAQSQPAPPSTPAELGAAAGRQKEMRKAIAAAMSRSKREIPHYYLSETIPMAAALAWLQQRNEGLPITERILPAVLLLKAVALALKRSPQFNGFYSDGGFLPSDQVHAGMAISLRGGGLVAPAIHDVAAKPLAQLMQELADLVRRARAGSLRSSEMSDPTITVTNLGDQGVQSVLGVIYPPQVALVGFGRMAVGPWVQAGEVCAVPLLTASLAADHRVSDGHQGALFLAELRDLLQQPLVLAAQGSSSED